MAFSISHPEGRRYLQHNKLQMKIDKFMIIKGETTFIYPIHVESLYDMISPLQL